MLRRSVCRLLTRGCGGWAWKGSRRASCGVVRVGRLGVGAGACRGTSWPAGWGYLAVLAGFSCVGGAALAPSSEAAVGPIGGVASSAPTGAYVPGQVLVKFRDTSTRVMAAAMRSQDASVKRSLPIRHVKLLQLGSGQSPPQAALALEKQADVVWAQPNYYDHLSGVSNDPYLSEEWALHNVGQVIGQFKAGTAGADISAPQAWDVTTGSENVLVAVIDSGIAFSHPDLAPQIAVNPGESGSGKDSNGVDDDSNGLVDDVRGWDFVDNDNNPSDPTLAFQHGTLVASIIGARGGDGSGVTGVAQHVRLLPIRVADTSGTLTEANAAAGMAYAGMRGAKIANVSFGGVHVSDVERDAMAAYPNTLYVTSAGNDSLDNDANPVQPCGIDLPNVVCVAATGLNDELASFSDFGATTVDLGAPGVGILGAQQPFADFFTDGFETDLSKWTQGPGSTWARTNDAAAAGGSFSLTDSPGGNYQDNSNFFIRTTSPVDLSSQQQCRIDYSIRLDTEPGFDFVYVEAATDPSGPWTALSRWSGSFNGAFVNGGDSLAPFVGDSSVYVRFRFESDATNEGDGAYIDDVGIRCSTENPTGHDFTYGDGTSFSAPMVSGIAALVDAAAPDIGVADTKKALLAGVDPIPALAGKTVTGGRANAAKALASIPPAAVTEPATAAGSTSVALNGIARPHARAGTYLFQYGPTSSYDSQTPTRTIAATLGDQPVTETLTGVGPSAAIHYRLVVSTPVGTAYGADQTASSASSSPVSHPLVNDHVAPVVSGARLTRDRKGRITLSFTLSETASLAGVVDSGTGALRNISQRRLRSGAHKLTLGRLRAKATVSLLARDDAGNAGKTRELVVPNAPRHKPKHRKPHPRKSPRAAHTVRAIAIPTPAPLLSTEPFGEGSQGFVFTTNPAAASPTPPEPAPNDCLETPGCAKIGAAPTACSDQYCSMVSAAVKPTPLPADNSGFTQQVEPAWGGRTVVLSVPDVSSDVRVVIDWGDHTGVSEIQPCGPPICTTRTIVTPATAHTYADVGSHTVTVTYEYPDGSKEQSQGTALTSNADPKGYLRSVLPVAGDAVAAGLAVGACTVGTAVGCAAAALTYIVPKALWPWCVNSPACLGPKSAKSTRRPMGVAPANSITTLVRPRVEPVSSRLPNSGVPRRARPFVVRMLRTQSVLRADVGALAGSLDRADQALQAGALPNVSMQVLAARRFASRLAGDLQRDLQNRKALVSALRRFGFKRVAVSKATAVRLRKKLLRHGFPPTAKRQLRAAGLTNSEISELRSLITKSPPAASAFPDALIAPSTVTAERREIANLKRVAASL